MYPETHSSERPEIIEQIRSQARGVPYRPAKRKNEPLPPPNPEDGRYLFTVYTGNRWMELGTRAPAAKMLFGEFWYQHELCFLFANTNTGKSILAVQIGNAIARGSKAGPFPCQALAAKVLYADFELSNLQFHRRYSALPEGDEAAIEPADGPEAFHENFLRAQFNPVPADAGSSVYDRYQHDDLLMAGLEFRIQQLQATVLIIDNISCLGGGTGNAAAALRLMNKLNVLRSEYKLSVLVLAHTPKRRNPSHPISENDLHGSKLLINFADSAFTIGVSSTDKELRYLKQVKQRSTHQVYGEDKVCLCRIQKPDDFLQFKFEGHSTEEPHLATRAQIQRDQVNEEITKLAAQGHTQRQISQELNIALGTVNKVLKG